MKNSAQKIRTSHVGRLPVPQGFEQTALRLARGEVGGEEVAAQVVPVVADVVKRQVEIGLDCIGDGEYWSALDIKWFDQQMTGLSTRLLKPGEVGSMRESTRERDVFRTAYKMNTRKDLGRLFDRGFDLALARRTGLEQYAKPWPRLRRGVAQVERHMPTSMWMAPRAQASTAMHAGT